MTARFLTGVRVLDMGGEAAARAGRMLADLGAEVILVEPPGGSPGRTVPPLLPVPGGGTASPHFLYTSAGKRSVTLAARLPAGRLLLDRLISTADVVLAGDDTAALRDLGLTYGAVRAVNERTVLVAITAFGLSGPRRRWRSSDLVAWASSGGLPSIGDPDRPPVAPGGGLAHAAAALNAVAGAVIALRAQRRHGPGQMVDISMQEAVLSVTMESGPFYPLEGARSGRQGARRGAASGHFSTSDGLVELLPFMPGQWDALAEWIRDEVGIEEATMDVFRGSPMVRAPYAEVIDAWVQELTGRYTKQEFFVEAQRRGIPCGPVNEPTDLLSDPHLETTGGWIEGSLPGGAPMRWPQPPLRLDREAMPVGPVPGIGQHNEAVYRDLLGLEPTELADLQSHGVI